MNATRRHCIVAGLGAALPWAAAAEPLRSGETMQWPTLRLLDGSTLAPSAWQGMTAVVVFWATWCAFCKRHNAHIDKLHRTLAGRPVRVLGAAIDNDEAAVRRYLAATGYQFPVTLESQSLRSRMTARRVVPMTCVVNADGRFKLAIPGEMTEADVLDLAIPALSGQA
jgi:thiol-disulfide isomerase/thioredoxin